MNGNFPLLKNRHGSDSLVLDSRAADLGIAVLCQPEDEVHS